MVTNVHILRYLWEIYRELPGSWKQRKRILSKMESSIRDYVSDGAHVRYEQLKTRFGDPKQIASTYVSEMEAAELLQGMQIRRRFCIPQ